jgi:ubiquinone/menaquinone biosynthesis C-methylase UbiE
MGLIDKKNILPRADGVMYLELELGCGNRKRNRQAIGVDMLDYPDVDIVGDVYEVLASFPTQSVDAVYSYHFVEHLPDVPKLLSELARIVKPNGHVEFVAPHFSNPYFYSDPTHLSFFGLYTFCYFTSKSPFARHVPTYGYKAEFRIAKVDLIFKSARPFIVRYGIKRLVGSFFNSCTYLKELYEENFCYMFPCYEVRYVLRRQELDT